ncbi:hypothetical protein [Limihaloglobus sulfuriphilus]|uniref:hypothetical protein n=1 Tax=Limihaloglobus sulfuriphilus TaxID=1851148 RepID=UPI00164A01D8|nr:hypothetical protein [Limihaloglobus sulfuriphilus]
MKSFIAGFMLRFFAKKPPKITDAQAHGASHSSNMRKLGISLSDRARSRMRRKWLRRK